MRGVACANCPSGFLICQKTCGRYGNSDILDLGSGSAAYAWPATVLVDELDTNHFSIKSYARGPLVAATVLAHENCRVSIVKKITGEVWQLHNEFAGDVGMTVGGDKNAEARRSEQRRHELLRRFGAPQARMTSPVLLFCRTVSARTSLPEPCS